MYGNNAGTTLGTGALAAGALPLTGLNVIWLVLAGVTLVCMGGALLRLGRASWRPSRRA